MTRTIQFGYDENDEPLKWPAVWEICSRCHGEGTHVNPSIDGNGIAAEEFAQWDEADQRMYLEGGYDVTCHECNGEGKVLEIDEDKLTAGEMNQLDDLRREQWEADAADRSERIAFGYDH